MKKRGRREANGKCVLILTDKFQASLHVSSISANFTIALYRTVIYPYMCMCVIDGSFFAGCMGL